MERLCVTGVVSTPPTTSGRTSLGSASGRVGVARTFSFTPKVVVPGVNRGRSFRASFAPLSCRSAPDGAPAWNDSFDGRDADSGASPQWDVMGLGQAIVDFSATVSDEFLQTTGAPKGGRRVISIEERGELISDLDGSSYSVNAGGSLSNSLVALARLGRAEAQLSGSGPLRVALGGSIGQDALGEFYRAKITKAGLNFISEPEEASATGTVIVLTTPDAQRSFLSYPGTAHDMVADAATTSAAASSKILVIEGYLWEMPNAWEGISHAIKIAKKAGTAVAMSAGDVGVVERHRDEMMQAWSLGVDVMFTNAAEASCLMGLGTECAEEAAMMLGSHIPLGVVTDGSRGAYVAALGRVQHVEPHWSEDKPVDTNGAGDAYAAGVLYGLLNGYDIQTMGRFGARVASAVISRVGARLKKDDAMTLVHEMAQAHSQGALLPPEKEVSSVVPTKVGGVSLRLRSLAVRALPE